MTTTFTTDHLRWLPEVTVLGMTTRVEKALEDGTYKPRTSRDLANVAQKWANTAGLTVVDCVGARGGDRAPVPGQSHFVPNLTGSTHMLRGTSGCTHAEDDEKSSFLGPLLVWSRCGLRACRGHKPAGCSQIQRFQRKKPTIPTIVATITPTTTQNAACVPSPGEADVHPEDPGDQRQRQHHDAEDREDLQHAVLPVRDHRLVRVLERLDDLLVVVELVPDPLGRVDDVVEVQLELLRQEPLDVALEQRAASAAPA